MKFIKSKVPKKDIRKGYLLIISTMAGDGDGYEDIEVGCFQEDELHLLEEVINVCDRMTEAYPHGRGGDDEYNHIEGFYRWFSQDCEDIDGNEMDISDIEHLAPFHWTHDSSGWYSSNSIDGYKVVYLEDGYEYQVEIVK